MITKKQVLIIALLVVNALALPVTKTFAQKDDILRRLKADEVKSSIYLHIRNEDVFFLHDVIDNNRVSAGFRLPESEKLLWTSKAKKLRLSIGFYNPYQYSVNVATALTDDPISKTTEELFAALTGMLNVITKSTPIGTSTGVPASSPSYMSEDNNVFAAAARLANANNGGLSLEKDHLQQFRSPSIIEWSLWIQTVEARACHLDKTQIGSIVENVANIENLLYHKFDIADDNLPFQSYIRKITSVLYTPEDVDSLNASLKAARTIYKGLLRQIEGARKSINDIKLENKALTLSGDSLCAVLPLYHQMVFAQYLSEADEKIKKLDKVMKTTDELIKVGEYFLNTNKVYLFNGKEKEIIYNKEIDVEDDKINTITLEIKHQEIDKSDSSILATKKEFKRSFEITKFRRAWPEISSGIFYSDIEYNTFSPGETTAPAGGGPTTSTVVQTTTQQRFMAALFYNQVFDTRLHPIYPFLQIGVGTGKDYPCLLAGGGFRLINKDLKRISISGGAVFPFTKELDNLKVGDTLTNGQAEIDDDIRYRLGSEVGFYVGVAWKLN